MSTISFAFPVPDTFAAILFFALALIIVWVVVSIPVYAAGKLVTAGKADFGQAMGATLGGGVAYFLVLYGGTIVLSLLIGPAALAISFFLALVVWMAVYRASFDTGWLGTLAIVVMAWLVFFAIDAFLVGALGVAFPKFYPF